MKRQLALISTEPRTLAIGDVERVEYTFYGLKLSQEQLREIVTTLDGIPCDMPTPPSAQAKAGRCNATFSNSAGSWKCARWKGHDGMHRGPRIDRFYGGERCEWGIDI